MIRRPPRSTRLTHSFPTRRSSDLVAGQRGRAQFVHQPGRHIGRNRNIAPATQQDQRGGGGVVAADQHEVLGHLAQQGRNPGDIARGVLDPDRSEEHTSELQSLMRISYAVFCLKKKTTENRENKNISTYKCYHM